MSQDLTVRRTWNEFDRHQHNFAYASVVVKQAKNDRQYGQEDEITRWGGGGERKDKCMQVLVEKTEGGKKTTRKTCE
jgi:hypothetical protein